MTQAELDALPEFHRFNYIEEIIDGRKALRPVMNELQLVAVDWLRDDDPIAVVDADGNRWSFTRINGVLHKLLR